MRMNRMTIRQATPEDLGEIIRIEQVCFPAAEAASAEVFQKRFAAFGENFLVAEIEGTIVGFINGCTTDRPELPDELYHDCALHKPEGAYQTVFGLDVLPEFRGKGIARQLLTTLKSLAKERGKEGMVLTCKDYLIPFYSSCGFEHLGKSSSTHGGSAWNDMVLKFYV